MVALLRQLGTIMTEALAPARLAGSLLSRSCHVCAFFHSKEEEWQC